MATYRERLKEEYAKDFTFPDVWKMPGASIRADIYTRSAMIVKSLRSAVQAVKLNYLLIGKILFTAKSAYMSYVYLEDGCSYDLFTWAEREFKLKKSALYAAILAYEAFCINDKESALPVLKPEYEGYSHSQLVEILPMEPSQRRDVTPNMTVKEIRAYKASLDPKKEKPEPKEQAAPAAPEQRQPIVIECEPETKGGRATTEVLPNEKRRKAWLENYRAWGVWLRVPQLGMTYYRYDFGNGDSVIVDEVEVPKATYNKEGIDRHWHLLERTGYRSHWNPGGNAMSEIIDYLQKKRPAVIVYPEQSPPTE